MFYGGAHVPAAGGEIFVEWLLSASLFFAIFRLYRRHAKTGFIELTDNSITMPVSLEEGPQTTSYASILEIKLQGGKPGKRLLVIRHKSGFIGIPEIRLHGDRNRAFDEIVSHLKRHVYIHLNS